MGTRARTAHIVLLGAVLLLSSTAFGCASANQPPAHSAVVTSFATSEPPGLSGAEAVNAFGFDLMRARLASDTSPAPNIVLSPLSVHAALSMTLQGAAGSTAAEMLRTLHLSGDATAAASTYSLLLSALDDRSKEQTLSVANALWIDQHLPMKNEFLNANRTAFGASARTLDFTHDDVVSVVNKWVESSTRGMIPKIIDSVDPLTVMVLADAVYFKARWSEEFGTRATSPESFHTESGQTTDVPTMHATTYLPVVTNDVFSATKLGYLGGDSAAYIILPNRTRRLGEVLSGLTSADFAGLRKRLDSTPSTLTALALPKFDTAVGGDIGPTLEAMGMPTAFDPVRADFSGMATVTPDENIWIDQVVHKARLKVNEQGTEAAAATVVVMRDGTAAQPVRVPLPFVCDHPFAIAIVDTRSGALLFLAAIRDPKAH